MSTNWETTRSKVFAHWINYHLSKKHVRVSPEKLCRGELRNGTILATLLEVLSKRLLVGSWTLIVKSDADALRNLGFCFDEIKKDITLDITPEQILANDSHAIFSLCWSLVQIYGWGYPHKTFEEAKTEATNWIKSIEIYLDRLRTVRVYDFCLSFSQPYALCNLVSDYYKKHESLLASTSLPKPENSVIISPDSLTVDRQKNIQLALNAAQQYLGIPTLGLTPSEFIENVDLISIMTYISFYKRQIPQFSSEQKIEISSEVQLSKSSLQSLSSLSQPTIQSKTSLRIPIVSDEGSPKEDGSAKKRSKRDYLKKTEKAMNLKSLTALVSPRKSSSLELKVESPSSSSKVNSTSSSDIPVSPSQPSSTQPAQTGSGSASVLPSLPVDGSDSENDEDESLSVETNEFNKKQLKSKFYDYKTGKLLPKKQIQQIEEMMRKKNEENAPHHDQREEANKNILKESGMEDFNEQIRREEELLNKAIAFIKDEKREKRRAERSIHEVTVQIMNVEAERFSLPNYQGLTSEVHINSISQLYERRRVLLEGYEKVIRRIREVEIKLKTRVDFLRKKYSKYYPDREDFYFPGKLVIFDDGRDDLIMTYSNTEIDPLEYIDEHMLLDLDHFSIYKVLDFDEDIQVHEHVSSDSKPKKTKSQRTLHVESLSNDHHHLDDVHIPDIHVNIRKNHGDGDHSSSYVKNLSSTKSSPLHVNVAINHESGELSEQNESSEENGSEDLNSYESFVSNVKEEHSRNRSSHSVDRSNLGEYSELKLHHYSISENALSLSQAKSLICTIDEINLGSIEYKPTILKTTPLVLKAKDDHEFIPNEFFVECVSQDNQQADAKVTTVSKLSVLEIEVKAFYPGFYRLQIYYNAKDGQVSLLQSPFSFEIHHKNKFKEELYKEKAELDQLIASVNY
eukprot:TRINITY_DN837_c0_g1_i3.p1 TRINITY_DN837_c0_g1~~TRINITY_DN837_c0_g1_i3.p1  ORF type:complete len:910 (+),score=210.61 TRINITY_DN837_c0_g1_i3:3015-5744(+)